MNAICAPAVAVAAAAATASNETPRMRGGLVEAVACAVLGTALGGEDLVRPDAFLRRFVVDAIALGKPVMSHDGSPREKPEGRRCHRFSTAGLPSGEPSGGVPQPCFIGSRRLIFPISGVFDKRVTLSSREVRSRNCESVETFTIPFNRPPRSITGTTSSSLSMAKEAASPVFSHKGCAVAIRERYVGMWASGVRAVCVGKVGSGGERRADVCTRAARSRRYERCARGATSVNVQRSRETHLQRSLIRFCLFDKVRSALRKANELRNMRTR